jgi:hypothetical protein
MKAMVLGYILFAVSIADCTRLDNKIQAWVGQPRDKLIKEFGPPTREMRLIDGRTVIWYEPRPTDPADQPQACREIFHLDSNGIVTSASEQNCVGLCLGPHCW